MTETLTERPLQTSESDETYRLADPFTCLVCGGEAPKGDHFCCPREQWGERFTRSVSLPERNEQIAKYAATLRVDYQHAERQLDGHKWGDYSETAGYFATSLRGYVDYASRQAHPPKCEDCGEFREDLHVKHGDFGFVMWPHESGRCPLARLHYALVTLSFHEDVRHALEPGSTMDEIERRGRERRITEKVERLRGATVGEIVNRALNGGT